MRTYFSSMLTAGLFVATGGQTRQQGDRQGFHELSAFEN
jgi:hypothetical protein